MRTTTCILVLAIISETIFAFPQDQVQDDNQTQPTSTSEETSDGSIEEGTTIDTNSVDDIMKEPNPLGTQIYPMDNSTSSENQINSSSTEIPIDSDYLGNNETETTEIAHNSLKNKIGNESEKFSLLITKLRHSISNGIAQQFQKMKPFFQWIKSSLSGVHMGLTFDDVDQRISLGGQVRKEIFQNRKNDLHITAHAAVSRSFGDPSDDSIKPDIGILIN